MRKKIVAGNWKMNLTREQSVALVSNIENAIANHDIKGNRVIIAPPFVNIIPVYEAISDNRVEVAAQNMHYAESGAFTGEISADMLLDIQVKTVIIGHSERREYFYEDDEFLKMKVEAALHKNMEVIFCFGEKLEDRSLGNHFSIVESQIKNALFQLSSDAWNKIVLAYEPVWAIGTGETATPDQAQEMHDFVRQLVRNQYDAEISNSISILYGGSVKPNNAKEIFSKPDVDGGLIGGASLKAEDFASIVKAM